MIVFSYVTETCSGPQAHETSRPAQITHTSGKEHRQEVTTPLVIDEDVKSWEGGADDNQIVCFNKYLVFNKGLELLYFSLCLMNLK